MRWRSVERMGEVMIEYGTYICHTCEAEAVWICGIGWKCDECGQEGHVILTRARPREARK